LGHADDVFCSKTAADAILSLENPLFPLIRRLPDGHVRAGWDYCCGFSPCGFLPLQTAGIGYFPAVLNRMSPYIRDPRPFKRAILKLSGEALREPGSTDNLSPEIVDRIAMEIREAVDTGLQLGIVVGGGNFWRGASASARGMDRATADYVGMLATVMNALALEGALEHHGVSCCVQSAIEMKNVAETFIRRKAERQLDEGKVVIFAAGTGSPFFSTDTTAALRASEMGADVILKATQVDGVYTADPRKHPDATRYQSVTFQECLSKRLNVMDATAFSLCMDNHVPVIIFDLGPPGNLSHALRGLPIGTLVHGEEALK
jgi:uridylate kinase